MTIPTNVPPIEFLPQGPTAPPEGSYGADGQPTAGSILAGVIADWIDAFASVNGAMNPSPATPQGQLASSTAAMIGNQNNAILAFCNLVDPALTFGRFQDAIARIYFLTRQPATPTIVTATCTGSGVTIPINAQAQDANTGQIYLATSSGTIPPIGGSITIEFAAQLPGPIECEAGALTIIYQAINGWDAITNVAAGVPGNVVENAQQFELRRQQSVAHNSIGSLPAILGAVLSVPNVLDAFVTDNSTNNVTTVLGYTLLPNSLYVAALGGDPLAIATAIWKTKGPGAAYNGNTTETVLDTSAPYTPPYPAYAITFEIPTFLTTLFVVRIKNSTAVPANATGLIQTAIINAFAGLDGGPRVTIAALLFASRYYAPVAALGAWAQIIEIKVGSQNQPDATFAGSISGTTLTVSSIASGTLVAGQTLFNLTATVLSNTQILSQSSGSAGGVGTYVVSVSQTTSLDQMYGVTADQDTVQPELDQIPTTSAPSIQVVLV